MPRKSLSGHVVAGHDRGQSPETSRTDGANACEQAWAEGERDDVEPDVAGGDAARRIPLRDARPGNRGGPFPGADRGAVQLEPGNDEEDARVHRRRAAAHEVEREQAGTERARDV